MLGLASTWWSAGECFSTRLSAQCMNTNARASSWNTSVKLLVTHSSHFDVGTAVISGDRTRVHKLCLGLVAHNVRAGGATSITTRFRAMTRCSGLGKNQDCDQKHATQRTLESCMLIACGTICECLLLPDRPLKIRSRRRESRSYWLAMLNRHYLVCRYIYVVYSTLPDA